MNWHRDISFQRIGSRLSADRRLAATGIAFGLILLAALWSALPVLINHWNFPPNDDPVVYQRMIDRDFFAYRNYYGHNIARIITLTYYYYITPLLTAVALIYAFRGYGKWAALALWVSVWLISRVALFDMYAGTFVAVLGIYATALIGLRVYSDFLERKQPGIVAAAILFGVVVFHNSSSVVFLVGIVGMTAFYIRGRWTALAVIAPAVVFAANRVLTGGNSNAARILTPIKQMVTALESGTLPPPLDQIAALLTISNLPAPLIAAFEPLKGSTLRAVAAFPSPHLTEFTLLRFVGEYVGPGLTVLLILGLAAAYDGWLRGWRPRRDPMVIGMLVIALALPLFVFTPLTPNGDRMAKMMLAHWVMLSMLSTVVWLRFRASRRLTIVVVTLLAGLAITGMLDNVP